MKIDGQPTSELLQRMQELHQESVEQTKTEGSDANFSIREPDTAPATQVESTSPLQQRIEVEATRALNGEFATDGDLRGAVIDVILDERMGDKLSAADRRKMSRTLKENLVDDPGFVRQVDDMLLLAARQVARRS